MCNVSVDQTDITGHIIFFIAEIIDTVYNKTADKLINIADKIPVRLPEEQQEISKCDQFLIIAKQDKQTEAVKQEQHQCTQQFFTYFIQYDHLLACEAGEWHDHRDQACKHVYSDYNHKTPGNKQ